MPEVITDADVRAAQAGDPAAFRRIYLILSPVVLGYLRAKGVADPEGATSDVFLAVLPRLRELRGGSAGLRTFVLSVAHARMVDQVRHQVRRPPAVPYEAQHDLRTIASAEDEAIGATSTQRLLELMAQLPDDQRDVIALRFVSDLALEDVATILDRSVGAVKQLQRRGLIALRALLETSGVTQR